MCKLKLVLCWFMSSCSMRSWLYSGWSAQAQWGKQHCSRPGFSSSLWSVCLGKLTVILQHTQKSRILNIFYPNAAKHTYHKHHFHRVAYLSDKKHGPSLIPDRQIGSSPASAFPRPFCGWHRCACVCNQCRYRQPIPQGTEPNKATQQEIHEMDCLTCIWSERTYSIDLFIDLYIYISLLYDVWILLYK